MTEAPQVAGALVDVVVVGDEHPALAGDEQLRPLEAEARRVSERPGAPPRDLGADGRRRVLDYEQAVPRSEVHDLVHPRRMAVKVHGHDRPSP